MDYYKHPETNEVMKASAAFVLAGRKYPPGYLPRRTAEEIAAMGFTPAELEVPPRPIAERRNDRLHELDSEANDKRNRGVIVLGNQFSANDGSLQALSIAIAAADADPTVMLALRAGRGRLLDLNANQVKQVANAIVRYQNRVLARQIELEAEIMASDDPEAIDIGAGWPAR